MDKDKEMHKELLKEITIVKHCKEEYEKFVHECKPDVTNISNFMEQYQCCMKTDVNQEFGGEFQDVKEIVTLKIEREIETKHSSLTQKIENLESLLFKLSNQTKKTMNLYQKICDHFTMDKLEEASAEAPPITDMLLWLQNVDKSLHEQLFLKKYWLDVVSSHDGWMNADGLQTDWSAGDKQLAEKLRDCLCYVTLYLDEKT